MESSTEFAQKVKARARIGSDNPAAGHTEIKLACQRRVHSYFYCNIPHGCGVSLSTHHWRS